MLANLDEVESVAQIDAEEIESMEKGNGNPQKLNVHNLHRILMRTGVEARPKEILRFIRSKREGAFSDATPELGQIRAVVKDTRFIEHVQSLGPKMKPLVAENLAADLWIVCVWDSPNGMKFATAEEPESYGFSTGEMLQRARANVIKERVAVEVTRHGPLFVARTNDSYDSSMLLDDKWCEEMERQVKGDLIACVPARHVVLLGSASKPGTVEEMRKAAARIEAGGDHLITNTILRRRDGKWERYDLEDQSQLQEKSSINVTTSAPPSAKGKRWWQFWVR